jgi:hypothetical protein
LAGVDAEVMVFIMAEIVGGDSFFSENMAEWLIECGV